MATRERADDECIRPTEYRPKHAQHTETASAGKQVFNDIFLFCLPNYPTGQQIYDHHCIGVFSEYSLNTDCYTV